MSEHPMLIQAEVINMRLGHIAVMLGEIAKALINRNERLA